MIFDLCSAAQLIMTIFQHFGSNGVFLEHAKSCAKSVAFERLPSPTNQMRFLKLFKMNLLQPEDALSNKKPFRAHSISQNKTRSWEYQIQTIFPRVCRPLVTSSICEANIPGTNVNEAWSEDDVISFYMRHFCWQWSGKHLDIDRLYLCVGLYLKPSAPSYGEMLRLK